MPAIDSLDAKKAVVKRQLRKHNTEKEVRKAIADNLKGMTAAELHAHADKEGKTCAQRLAERKRAHRTDPVANPVGANFYKDPNAMVPLPHATPFGCPPPSGRMAWAELPDSGLVFPMADRFGILRN